MYLALKHSHLLLVVLTVVLFQLRFFWRLAKPQQPLPAVWRRLPHMNDTLLLLSGLLLMWMAGGMPFGNAPWLGVKLVLLLVYIGFGLLCFKSEPRSAKSLTAYAAAMLSLAAIYYLARYKPLLW